MKILVTGTAGFIGFHLANELAKQGHAVVGLDNINDYYDVRLKYARLAEAGIIESEIEYNKFTTSVIYPNYRFTKLNLEDKENIQQIFKTENFEVVCNLAAQAGVRYSLENPYTYIQSNIIGFLNILEGCRHNDIKHFVYASSSSVYGNSHKVPFSEDDVVNKPISLYAATKISNELMAYSYSHLYNLKTTGLRFFTVYGPWGRPDMAPMLFTKAILNNEPINVFNNGNLSRDFTYIDDIVEGVIRVIFHSQSVEAKEPSNIYNIGCSAPIQLIDFIKELERAIGKSAKLNMLPMQPGDVENTYSDTTKLEDVFDFRPLTTFEQGIREFINWYQF